MSNITYKKKIGVSSIKTGNLEITELQYPATEVIIEDTETPENNITLSDKIQDLDNDILLANNDINAIASKTLIEWKDILK